MSSMRFTVFNEFKDKDVLTKLPGGVTVEMPSDAWRIEESKRSDEEKSLLATNAKLIFDPAVDKGQLNNVVEAITKLGFKEVSRFPSTVTGHTMDDRIIFALQ
ncbi:hypothetical protein DIPPA_11387 [Diplonema papillatum]|nr:hypothetical protein DIPPA_11387 [Diplonema papillatum]